MVFSHKEFRNHQEIVYCADPSVKLRAIIAIHDLSLGPATGGVRMWPYANEEEALTDVLRLSHGMTLKNAITGLPLGGGKSVILQDESFADPSARQEALRVFAGFVESLHGRYWAAKDVGIGVPDVLSMAKHCQYIAGLKQIEGSQDPSPITALGTLSGIRAALQFARGSDSLDGVTVTVQGLGHVGFALARLLHKEGARLKVADLNPDVIKTACNELGAEEVPLDQVHSAAADVFAPCALGAILNQKTIPELGAKIVAGSANNQLLDLKSARLLQEVGVLYAPDFVINGGGIVMAATDILPELGPEKIKSKALSIGDKLLEIFEKAQKSGISTHEVAVKLAEDILCRHKAGGNRKLAS